MVSFAVTLYVFAPILAKRLRLETKLKSRTRTRLAILPKRNKRNRWYVPRKGVRQPMEKNLKERWLQQRKQIMREHKSFSSSSKRKKKSTTDGGVSFSSQAKIEKRKWQHIHCMDTDTQTWHVDNCSSYSLSFDRSDFTGALKSCNISVGALGGTKVTATHKGTMICRIQSDDGLTHAIKIPDAYYVPKSKYRVLCPQHWA